MVEMNWRRQVALILSLLFLLGTTPKAMAMTPEEQKAYDQWYQARFGTPAPSQQPPSSTPTQPPQTVQPAQPTAMETGVLGLLNVERAKHHLQPVQMDPYLVQLARLKGQDMVANNYYGHFSPTYGYSYNLLSRYHIPFKRSSENLTVAGSALGAHTSWLGSEPHYEKMLKPYWTHVGIGFVRRPGASLAYGYYVIELFVER
jgi:uncharacterized protein YkwD